MVGGAAAVKASGGRDELPDQSGKPDAENGGSRQPRRERRKARSHPAHGKGEAGGQRRLNEDERREIGAARRCFRAVARFNEGVAVQKAGGCEEWRQCW